MSAYAELVAASNFSFLRGASHPEEMVAAAKALGLAAIALCDRNTLAGVVRAHAQAKAEGIAFIPGCRLVLMDGVEIACLPKTRAAYGRLCQLLTTGNRRAVKGECTLFLDDVLRFGEEQIFIALPPRALNAPPAFLEALAALQSACDGRVYLGAALYFDGLDARRLARLRELSKVYGPPLVAVGDCLYHRQDRKPLQDVLTCIREKCTVAEAGFRLEANSERHLKAPGEMARLFAGYEDALARTLRIAKALRFSLDELRYEYPDEPYDPFPSPQAALVHHTWRGAAERFPSGVPEKIKAQIDHELALIEKLQYARYFLTVFDLVAEARRRGILCQGRGSAANSAVCFCLGITSVNPAEIDLLFERFISLERNEPPDIDVDFEHERREEVMQYIYEKYGRHRAGLVATVVTYRGKSAIREVGKALGLSQDIVHALSGMLSGWSAGLSERDLREAGLDGRDGTLGLAIRLAGELMGFPRHLSQHTGGFVITRGALDEIVPIGNTAMDGRTMIEWNKDDLDDLGLLKIDVLALGMLTCLRKAFGLLERHHGIVHDLASIPQGDRPTYEMIAKADTIGVFQIESRAQMSMLPRLKPKEFYDLVIEVAIVRPGPIQGDMVHPYLRRRQGIELVHYESEALKEILKKTLGVPLFQEQCMKIAIVAAGFSPSRADQLRRAMATFRRVGTIHTFKREFLAGMAKNGYSAEFAERCFAQIQGFGTYGFPESHAASFARLVYVSSYLKCHFPDVFACALLNSQPMGFYAPAQIVRDFLEHGGQVRPVDVNHSHWDCTLEPLDRAAEPGKPKFALRLGFRQIKGLCEQHAGKIIAARTHPFFSMDGFAARTKLPAAVLELLAAGDAFSSLGLDRRAALWAVLRYMKTGTPAALLEKLPLFAAAGAEPLGQEEVVALPPMPLGAAVLADYARLRLSLKAHPMALLREAFARDGHVPLGALKTLRPGRLVKVTGLVLVRQRPGTASGVVFATLEDETGAGNVIIWSKVFERYRRAVLGGQLISVKGVVQNEQGVVHVVAREIIDKSGLLDTLRDHERAANPHHLAPAPGAPRAANALPKGRDFH